MMRRHVSPLALLLALSVAVHSLVGCAVLCPKHSVRSTMTLLPGQTVTGRFEALGGGLGLVQFQRQAPRKGVPPFPEATTWTGDGKVLMAFPPWEPELKQLGYSTMWVEAGLVRRVVVRNATDGPVTFDWIVSGSCNFAADWDLTGAEEPR